MLTGVRKMLRCRTNRLTGIAAVESTILRTANRDRIVPQPLKTKNDSGQSASCIEVPSWISGPRTTTPSVNPEQVLAGATTELQRESKEAPSASKAEESEVY